MNSQVTDIKAPAQPESFPVPDKALWPKAKVAPKRAAFEKSFQFMAWAAMARRPKLTTWDLTWFPTYLCNLKCWYCNSIFAKAEPANPEKAVKRIIELKPTSISILGGEPYVVKGMVDYIRQIREGLPKAFIMVTTNGMVKSEHIAETVPLIDSMCFSIDGEGKFQSGPRGGDSDKIIANIKVAHETRVKERPTMDLVANAVVSKYNALHLPAFYRRLKDEISPTILAFSQGLMPFDGPHSIGSAPEVAAEFSRQMAQLKKEMRTLVVGQLSNEQTRNQGLHEVEEARADTRIGCSTCRCHQERFFAHITPGGHTYTCATYAGINGVKDRVLSEVHEKKYVAAARDYLKGFYKWVIKAPSFDCTEFRGCPEWAEDLMNVRHGSDLPPEAFRVSGRMDPEMLAKTARFIRKHVNKDYASELLSESIPAPHMQEAVDIAASGPNCR